MMLSRPSWQLVLAWSCLAALTLGQGSHAEGDPSCPNCNRSAPPPLEVLPAPVMATPAEAVAPDPNIPVVKLRVRAPACAVVGKEMEYRIKVENCSPADAHNVIVRTTLPASVRLVRASPQIHAREPELLWNLGTLPGFGCHDLVLVAMPIGLADIKSCTRVQFEYGQCVTTKVIALAPDGSAEEGNRFPGAGPGGLPPGGLPPGGQGTREPGTFDGNRVLDVRVNGPKDAGINLPTKYQISVINRGDRTLYLVGVTLVWDKGLDHIRSTEKLLAPPGLPPVWPDPLIAELPPGGSKTLEIELRAAVEGVLCVTAKASGNTDPKMYTPIKEVDTSFCTRFARFNAGLTMEMFDHEDPILKDGRTTYPITVRNQGQSPATNIRIKARIPELLELDQANGPVQYRSGMDNQRQFWVEFDPLPTLNGGETQTYNIAVKARGREGDARFHVEMTSDQFDRGPRGEQRWIIEQESTTIVPDEESRIRIREISRQKRAKVPVVLP